VVCLVMRTRVPAAGFRFEARNRGTSPAPSGSSRVTGRWTAVAAGELVVALDVVELRPPGLLLSLEEAGRRGALRQVAVRGSGRSSRRGS
jgi:hypothetical protein